MELTDLERRTQEYAARCFDMRYALIQQWAGDILMRLVSNERAWVEYDPKDMPDLALAMTNRLLEEIDTHADAKRLDWREYYARRFRMMTADWDASKFGSEHWLKNALEPKHEAGEVTE